MQSLESNNKKNNLILNLDVIQQYTSFQRGGNKENGPIKKTIIMIYNYKHKSNVITLKASFSLHIDIAADHIT